MPKTKVYSVTLEVRIVVRATSRQDAMLKATETNEISKRFESLRVTDIFCPADGPQGDCLCGKPTAAHFRRGRKIDCQEVR